MDRAYSWPLWGAAYTIGGGCGDDSFMDFRGTLLTHGRDVYEGALAGPDSLADLAVQDGDQLFYEGYQYVGGRVVKQRLGKMPARAGVAADAPVGQEWDDDELPNLYPRLTARFRSVDEVTAPVALDAQSDAGKLASRKPWWKFW
jgi:hypothetical protein